jgi:hypothetical protein
VTWAATGAATIGTPSSAVTAFTISAAANAYTIKEQGNTTNNQSFGMNLQAGTSASDTCASFANASGGTTNFLIDGAGSVVVGNGLTGLGAGTLLVQNAISLKGATPAVAAGRTDLGITTTATVITTAGGIALPALASTFWVVNVNGVKYGVPCFAL